MIWFHIKFFPPLLLMNYNGIAIHFYQGMFLKEFSQLREVIHK